MMSGCLTRVDTSPILTIPSQTTATSAFVQCLACKTEKLYEQMAELIHRINQGCDAHTNRRICQLCLEELDECPACQENLSADDVELYIHCFEEEQEDPVLDSRKMCLIALTVTVVGTLYIAGMFEILNALDGAF